jgi:hypothetical protein
MSAYPNFSNFTFSRAPVKLSSILLPLLLTYPCAFSSLVWEQLVELLLQKWPDSAKPAQAYWISWRCQRKLHRSNRKDPHSAPVHYRGHERGGGLLSLAPTPRSHCTPLSSTRRVQQFPSNVFSFHDIYPVLTQAKPLHTNFAKPKGPQSYSATTYRYPHHNAIPSTNPELRPALFELQTTTTRLPHLAYSSSSMARTDHEGDTVMATILPNLVPRNSKSNPL